MIISNKQIMQLITIVHAYVAAMHRMGQHQNCEAAQILLADINDMQSDQPKEISDDQ